MDVQSRWQQVDSLLGAALERPADERTAFLRAACGDDPALYGEVAALLEDAPAAERLLGESATDFAAPLLPGLRDALAADATDLAEGSRVGPYRIVREVGRGGMGVVYRAERADGAFEKAVALKLVKRGMDTDEVLRRFRQERQILAGLDHPGIARLVDAGAAPDGRPYLVMEFVDGTAITAYADLHRLGVTERVGLAERMAEAVTYAHRRLVVHRDLKPGNVLVADDDGRPAVKLLDFGIARLLDAPAQGDVTRGDWRVMTPEYAAPEQRRGEPATAATDVYALGVILYELLAGRRPGDRPAPPSATVTSEAAAARGTSLERVKRKLRGDLDTLVLTALHEEPGRRYASAEAMLDDLRRFRVGLPLRARPDSRRYRAGKFVGRHPAGVAISAAAGLLLVGFTAALALQQRATARERDRAEDALAQSEQTAGFLEGLLGAADPYSAERLDTLQVAEVLDRAVTALERDLGDQPLVQARLLGVVGRANRSLGRYDAAEAALRRALELSMAGDPLDRARIQSELGLTVFEGAGGSRDDEVDSLFQEVLEVRRAVLGPNHPDVASALNDLGLVSARRGDVAAAEAHFRAGLGLLRAAPEPDTMETATMAKNLADLLAEGTAADEAEALLRESLALRRAHLGDGHPGVAVGLQSLATFLRGHERYDEAEPLVREALALNEDALGEDHPYVSDNLTLLGSVLRGRGDLAAAGATLRTAVARVRARDGHDHPDLAIALNTYAGVLLEQQQFREARVALLEAVAIARGAFGDSHPAVAFNLSRLSRAEHGLGAHDAEYRGASTALGIFDASFGAGNLHSALARGALGDCLIDRRYFGEAEDLLAGSHAALSTLHEDEHPRLVESRQRLRRLAAARRRPQTVAGL